MHKFLEISCGGVNIEKSNKEKNHKKVAKYYGCMFLLCKFNNYGA